ncbi:hypothetical protein ERJ75_000550200 [Trypanosoma vivax]|nr:hypothetical protein ERJ75_000550200 [Trypanosoma vivax]
MDLRSAMVSFELPKSGDFIRAFGVAKECFQNESHTLEDGMATLFRQCGAARLQIHEERQRMQAHFATADGEGNDLKQWIFQMKEQKPRMLERVKNLQNTNGVLSAENEICKLGGSKRPIKREA